MQELFELKLGNLTMEEYEKSFLELLGPYVDIIGEENVKIQRFLSGLPLFYKDQITYDEPRALKECIRKAKCMYDKVRVSRICIIVGKVN